jgi:hypothetical protein
MERDEPDRRVQLVTVLHEEPGEGAPEFVGFHGLTKIGGRR